MTWDRRHLRIAFNRLRRGKWRERCAVCGHRMPLDGSGIAVGSGILAERYHVRCHLATRQVLSGGEPEARIRELEAERDEWRRMAEVNLDAADRHLAELVRYREALEAIAGRLEPHRLDGNEWTREAWERADLALSGGDEDG